MNEEIKNSIKKIISVSEHKKNVGDFARKKYNEKFDDSELHDRTWRVYDGFEIISETQIKVKFSYGGGDMEFSDGFIVDLD